MSETGSAWSVRYSRLRPQLQPNRTACLRRVLIFGTLSRILSHGAPEAGNIQSDRKGAKAKDDLILGKAEEKAIGYLGSGGSALPRKDSVPRATSSRRRIAERCQVSPEFNRSPTQFAA